MFLKKSMCVISLLICISATTCVKSEEKICLWVSLLSAGYVGCTVAGGLLGAFFPSPTLEVNGGNFTWVVGTIAASGAYMGLLTAVALAPQPCYDCVRRNCSN